MMGYVSMFWQSQDDELDASVSCTSLGGVIGVDGFVRSVANGVEPTGIDAPVNEVLHDRVGAILRQL